MQRDLVDNKKWITHSELVEGFALAQLATGLLAAQLAIYSGWVRYRVLSTTLVGFAFILPLFLMCAFLKKYKLNDLYKLTIIVRGADTERLDVAPQTSGLLAITLSLLKT